MLLHAVAVIAFAMKFFKRGSSHENFTESVESCNSVPQAINYQVANNVSIRSAIVSGTFRIDLIKPITKSRSRFLT